MKTIGSRLDEMRGIGPGFDFLRIALALSVLCTHSFLIAEGERHQFQHVPVDLMHASILPMFFALSGFLITASAMRLRLRDFVLNRGMRIVPALAVDIFVSALIIGPLFTTEPLRDYYSDYEFRAYFANIIGLIHYVLPGVFADNPFPRTVNGSLWTVPFEIGCYVIISAYIFTGILKRKWLALGVAVAISLAIVGSYWFDANLVDNVSENLPYRDSIRTALHHFTSAEGTSLYIYFLFGSMFYLLRYAIPFAKAAICLAAGIFFVGAFGLLDFIPPALRIVVYCPVVVYITVYVGLCKIPSIPVYKHGDYSYGIYLYGYPLQQAIVALFPAIVSPWLHMAISVPAASIVAMASWHFVEKPILRLRRKFSFTAQKGDATLAMPEPTAEEESEPAIGMLQTQPPAVGRT